MYCNQGFKNIVCNKEYVHNEYVYYYLLYNNNELNRRGNGVTFKEISKKVVESFPIIVPPLSVQHSIALELDSVQAMIDGYRQQIADLDALAQSIFLDTFGDPVSNPKGWKIIPMGQLGDLKNGLNYDKGSKGIQLKIIGVGDFQNHKCLTSFDCISSIGVENLPKEYLLRNEDIVFVRSNGNKNLVGRCLEVYPNDAHIAFSGFCIRFRKTVDVMNKYLIALLTDNGFKAAYLLKSNGIGIQNINQKLLSSLPIPIPPKDLQQHFAAQIDSIENQKALLRRQLEDAETLMAERMQYYFS